MTALWAVVTGGLVSAICLSVLYALAMPTEEIEAKQTVITGVVDFEKERAAGNLTNPNAPTVITWEGNGSENIEVGRSDQNNVIHWNGRLTLEMCQRYFQGQHDYTRWLINQQKRQEVPKP